jgi:hypothetical protein
MSNVAKEYSVDRRFCRAGGLIPPDLRGRDSLLATQEPIMGLVRRGEWVRPFRAAGALGPRGSTPRLGRRCRVGQGPDLRKYGGRRPNFLTRHSGAVIKKKVGRRSQSLACPTLPLRPSADSEE